ncbi:MAG: ADP-ribosylation factor-like protein [Promethearchaeia archaeon]
MFDDDGPTPKIYWPKDIDEAHRLLIAMKTISLLMGDAVYQNGTEIEGVNYFGILPFPDLKLIGLTYFFLIADEAARGQAKASTITILINEDNTSFFYENMKYLRILIDKAASSLQIADNLNEYKEIMDALKDELVDFSQELKDPFSAKRKIKIVYAGLDYAGKTSFLKAIKEKYSEIIKLLPTKGLKRSEEKLFSQQNSQISIWDLGGQKRYREKYIKQSKMYLYNIDLLFYLIDVQDSERIDEALDLYKDIITSLQELNEAPPIIVCLNKYDPDLKESTEINNNINVLTEKIKYYSKNFFIKIFKTSIFDRWSLISAYSFGLSQLSPNRDLFEQQLRIFANKTNSDAILLLNENGIILANYAKDDIFGKVFELSAPHFKTLYKTFKEFKLLEQDFIVSSGIADEAKKVVFKKIDVGKYKLYLMLFMEELQNIEKIEKEIPEFSNIIKELIKTYI